MTARVTVVFGRDADAATVARAADRALEGLGCFASQGIVFDEVCIIKRNQPFTCAAHMKPGQQLVIESSGTWRIEPVPAAGSAE